MLVSQELLDNLKRTERIYDLMALCCSYVLFMQEQKREIYDYELFEEDNYARVEAAFERYHSETERGREQEAFKELKEFLYNFLSPDITVEKCYAIIRFIDGTVAVEVPGKPYGISVYSSLNEQYTDQIRIIPRPENTLLHRSGSAFGNIDGSGRDLFRNPRECRCNRLDRETEHFSVWDQKTIKDYPATIYHINKNNPVSDHFQDRKKIVFGMVPFTNKRLDEILRINYHARAFYIDGMYDEAEKELMNRYTDVLGRCSRKDIDFLVFPEMLMTESMVGLADNKTGLPRFIVNGSVCRDHTNECIISDGMGNRIFSYLKKEQYVYTDKNGITYRERLDHHRSRKYTILEIDGIGRVGIAICKDLINENVRLFHKFIGTSILIVPAFTKSMDLKSGAEDMSENYNCIVVMVNACSAVEDQTTERKTGFLTIPAKKNTDRSKYTLEFCQGSCRQDCSAGCKGKIVTVNFFDISQENGFYHFRVEESDL